MDEIPRIEQTLEVAIARATATDLAFPSGRRCTSRHFPRWRTYPAASVPGSGQGMWR